MEIRVVSSLTTDDEIRYASTFLKLISAVLDNVALSYAIHVTHTDGILVHHGHGMPALDAEDRPERLLRR